MDKELCLVMMKLFLFPILVMTFSGWANAGTLTCSDERTTERIKQIVRQTVEDRVDWGDAGIDKAQVKKMIYEDVRSLTVDSIRTSSYDKTTDRSTCQASMKVNIPSEKVQGVQGATGGAFSADVTYEIRPADDKTHQLIELLNGYEPVINAIAGLMEIELDKITFAGGSKPADKAGSKATKPIPESIRSSAARPVTASPSGSVHFSGFEFDSLRFGREGPGYFPIKGESSKGAQYHVTAQLTGQEGIATAKFEAIDEKGNVIKLLHLFKLSDSLDDEGYWGYVEVPNQPFRITVSGQYVNGAPYKRIYERLFRPRYGFPSLPSMLKEESKLKAEFEEKRRAHPDGVIVLPRIQVANVTHEPYNSAKSNTLGIRIRYDVQFSEEGHYNLTPSVWLFFKEWDFRGSVDMKVADETITPTPDFEGQERPPGFHGYIMPARYQGGVVYHVVVDMVPDYVFRNGAGTKYCIWNQKFLDRPNQRTKKSSIWEAIKTKDLSVEYTLWIKSVGFEGKIEPRYPQKVFYEGFIREGAQDCGPQPNINF